MEDIKEIVAKNLIALRKKNNLTQQDLAEKLNYSDNTVSRWERAELCPSVETLQQISVVFDVPIELLFRSNILKRNEENEKRKKIRVLVTCLLCICLLLFGATITFFYCQSFLNLNLWTIFVWVIPASAIIMFSFGLFLKRRTFTFVMLSLFIWSFITAFYLQFMEYNLWLLFTLGVPAQLAWAVWCYVMPRKYKKPSKEKKTEQTEMDSKQVESEQKSIIKKQK